MTLIELLRSVEPAGEGGLEGLVSRCIAAELGLVYRPEAAGPQAGRDAGLFDPRTGLSAHIDIEAKRYSDSTSLRKRELFGELTEARRARPDTRQWILVATRGVPAATYEAIRDEGFTFGLNVVFLDSPDNGRGSLETLLASRSSDALEWVRRHDPSREADWTAGLQLLAGATGFEFHAQDLQTLLAGGYSFRQALPGARQWLQERIDGHRQRTDKINQQLGRVGKAPHISRPSLEAQIGRWLERHAGGQVLALLGGEGDGKTWAALDALMRAEGTVPLLITSNLFADSGADGVLAEALTRQCGGDYDHWRNLLVKNTGSWPVEFRLLLLVDGLNEAPSVQSELMIMDLLQGRWGSATDMIVTCRRPFWETRIEPTLRNISSQLAEVEVGPFDLLEEWPTALAHLGEAALSLPRSVTEALRNPRLWSFAFDLKDQIGGMGEITLERLLVEHWRMRRQERSDLSVDWKAFNLMVGQSVNELRQKAGGVSSLVGLGHLDRLLREMTGSSSDISRDLAEIQDGVFYDMTVDGRIQLRPERVPIALGLLLTQDVVSVAKERDPRMAAQRMAGRLLDDLPASDRVELILRTAVFATLALKGAALRVLPSLLRYWVGLQNREADFYHALAVVAAAAPLSVIEAIEDEKRDDEIVGEEILDELVNVLIGRRDAQNVRAACLESTERWLKSVPAIRYGSMNYQGLGLLESSVALVETLDDSAAEFLAYRPPADWVNALVNWTRRSVVLDQVEPDRYKYALTLNWLGWCQSLDQEDIERLQKQAASTEGWSSDHGATLAALLQGGTFRQYSLAQELGRSPWEEKQATAREIIAAAEGGKPPTTEFSSQYRDESADSTEAWLQLEWALLDSRSELLEPTVRAHLQMALDELDHSEVGGFGQFARDHALLLGDEIIPLIKKYVEKARASAIDRSGGFFAGRAVAAGLVVTKPDDQVKYLFDLGLHAGVERLDLTGFEARDDFGDVPHRTDDSRYFTWMALVSRFGDAPATEAALAAYRRDLDGAVHGAVAMQALARLRDPGIVTRFAIDLAVSHLPRETWAPKAYAAVLSLSIVPLGYMALRLRLRAEFLAQAAEADATPQALRALVFDFQRSLSRLLPLWTDFNSFDGIEAPPELLFGDRRASHGVSLPETARALRLVEAATPGFIAHLAGVLDASHNDDLKAAEGTIFLLSALAELAGEGRAAGWLGRVNWTVPRSTHRGLSVASPLVFSFTRNSQAAQQLREQMLRDAWTDGALADIACMARLEGHGAWLDHAIVQLLASNALNEKAKGILLSGFDGKHLTLEQTNDYLSHAAQIAGLRSERLHDQRRVLRAYRDAPDNKQAWLAYRRLCQLADRRLIVELEIDKAWVQSLPRSRRIQLELMVADYERLFRRNEGLADRLFAGVATPGIPPWAFLTPYCVSPQGSTAAS